MKFVDVFRPKANGLNFIRLLLATGVIVWHSFPLTGREIEFAPLRQILSNLFVDGFFAISGFLIVSSWLRRPSWTNFLRARLLRILPGFYVCLIVTAFAIAPLGIFVAGRGFPDGFFSDAANYVIHNGALRAEQRGIAGTPSGVPFPHSWNGSLWTLFWEFLCYLGVLGLGVTSLLKRRFTIPGAFLGCLFVVLLTSYGPVSNYNIQTVGRFGLMFSAGAMIYRYRRVLPASKGLLVVAGVAIALSAFLPDYRLTAALPIAYLFLTGGAFISAARLRFEDDISYGVYVYAFPIQQLIALAGATTLAVTAFVAISIACTVPVALASWFLVEKNALRFKSLKRAVPAGST